MRSQKGITLISVIIYVLAMIIVVAIVANVTRYFYKNVSTVNDRVEDSNIFTTFNSYFSEELNIYGNKVGQCDGESITFSNNNNQYTFDKDSNSIYFNQTRICKNIKNCTFSYNSGIIKVVIQTDSKTYTNTYKITNVN